MSKSVHHKARSEVSTTIGIGIRIRLVMGPKSTSWVLILNDNNQRQELHWSNVPFPLTQKLQECTNRQWPVKDLDLTGSRTYFVCGVKGTGSSHGFFGYRKDIVISDIKTINPFVGSLSFGERYADLSWCFIGQEDHEFQYDNLDPCLIQRLDILSSGRPTTKSIRFVRLFAQGSYVIQNSAGLISWGGPIPEACVQELKRTKAVINEIAISGDDEWVVMRPDAFIASPSVDPKLIEHLRRLYKAELEKASTHSMKKHKAVLESKDKALLRKEQELANRQLAVEEKEVNLKSKVVCLDYKEANLEREAKRVAEQQEKAQKFETHLEMKESDLKSMEASLKRKEGELARREKEYEEKVEEQEKIAESQGGEQDEVTEGSCVICLEDPAQRAFDACGHLCLCLTCATPNLRCPMCRQPGRIIQVFGIPSSQSRSQSQSQL